MTSTVAQCEPSFATSDRQAGTSRLRLLRTGDGYACCGRRGSRARAGTIVGHPIASSEEGTQMAVTTDTSPNATAIRPFTIDIPEADVEGLRARVAATRWPDRETVDDDSQGVPLALMQDLARYWATEYDWRAAEAKLNALPNYLTEIDGLDIHFIHVRSKHE